MKTRGRRASTLFLVVVLGTLVGLLAFGVAGVAMTSGRAESGQRSDSDLHYRCEAVAELLRLEVVSHLQASGKPAGQWLGLLRADWDSASQAGPSGVPGSPSTGPRAWPAFPDVQAWVDRVAAPGEGLWIEVVGATLPTVGSTAGDARAPRSARLRVNVGQASIFDLVMLTETTNCMFCHLRIRGDVGSIAFFRPGWGKENQAGHPDLPSFNDGSRRSGAGSSIVGDVYVGTMGSRVVYDGERHTLAGASDDADRVWQDNALEELSKVNGVDVFDPATYDPADPSTWGPGHLFEDYTGPRLPADTIGDDGVSDFPSFDPADARKKAAAGGGSIWAGDEQGAAGDGSGLWVVPVGGDWSKDRVTPARGTLGGVIDGNLVIIGTAERPIRIDGDVFVSGDVILQGPVSGQGAIYAGRNVYITGAVTYQETPAQWPLESDAQAQQAVLEDKDELRIAARSNIVIGDWTYLDEAGELQRVRDRQGEDYMNVQFDLSGQVRHYALDENGVSHELTWDARAGTFFDDLGRVVPQEQVRTVDATEESSWKDRGYASVNELRYDAALAPGVVTGDDAFDPWISQQEFRALLGTQTYDAMTWRMPGIPQSEAELREREFGEGWVKSDAPGQVLPAPGKGVNRFDQDALGEGQGMYVKAPWPAGDGSATARVMETGRVTWDRQVTHIDAFLYANKRIAGKVDVGSLTINGGMAAREIGVLAPGLRTIVESGRGGGAFPRLGGDPIPAEVTRRFAAPGTNAYGQTLADSHLLYDYRLRNGGFGFDLISAAGDLILYERGVGAAPDPESFR